jgi:hypothetical protein
MPFLTAALERSKEEGLIETSDERSVILERGRLSKRGRPHRTVQISRALYASDSRLLPEALQHVHALK